MWTTDRVDDARTRRRALAGRVALVPTMGALHAGHLAHVEQARRVADHVLVSIFVNPTQFAPGEDLDRYPRPLEDDLAACRAAGVTGVLAPSVDAVYPPGVSDAVIDVPELTRELEGAHRPGHYQGVCRVVAKLLNIFTPDVVTFGLKDYQQLKVIEAMVADLMIPVEILPVATVREPDGVAMSSRNQYLDAQQRHHALGLSKALNQARMLVEQAGEVDPAAVEQAMTQVLEAHHLEVDYAVVRHAQSLRPIDCIEPGHDGHVVALIAAWLGHVRLIDNQVLRPGA
ncbi:MAG: pantoate--beta-alanine ligase [Phycisphaeraceae bacterium]